MTSALSLLTHTHAYGPDKHEHSIWLLKRFSFCKHPLEKIYLVIILGVLKKKFFFWLITRFNFGRLLFVTIYWFLKLRLKKNLRMLRVIERDELIKMSKDFKTHLSCLSPRLRKSNWEMCAEMELNETSKVTRQSYKLLTNLFIYFQSHIVIFFYRSLNETVLSIYISFIF